MADQEFLASFAVEIDESGVSRLQQVLEENRTLAEEVASAFEAATAATRRRPWAGTTLPGKAAGTTAPGRARPPPRRGSGTPAAPSIRKRPPGTWRTGSTGPKDIKGKSRRSSADP